MSVRHQRITIFQEDDVTPILGSVDINGNVLVPTCSTDPAATRPYLIRTLELVPATVDFAEGSASIGQTTIRILDKRTVANDQTTGWFTAILASDGIQQLTGHRLLFEQQNDNGDYYTVVDGVIGDFGLEDDIVTYSLVVRDIRERERRMKLFDFNPSGISILPRGFGYDYGRMSGTDDGDTRILKRGEIGYEAIVYREPGMGGFVAVAMLQNYRHIFDSTNELVEALRYVPDYYDPNNETPFWQHFYQTSRTRYVRVQWRSTLGDPWTDLTEMPIINGSKWLFGSAYLNHISISNGVIRAGSRYRGTGIRLTRTIDDPELPADGSSIYIRVLLDAEPSEQNPLYIEKTFGQLLKDVYDGVYTAGDILPVRYNAARMAELVTNTPLARVKITKPVDDARKWLQENIYKPLGMVPFVNKDGEIEPRQYTLPPVDATLVQLDDSVIVSGDWGHPNSNIINRVEFTYYRDTLVLIDEDAPRTNANTEFIEREVKPVFVHPSTELHGPKTLEYDCVTVRAIADGTSNLTDPGNIQDELGYALARQRVNELFARFANGAQELSVRVNRSGTGVADIEAGDWVVVASSWMPDFESGTRGINRIFQVKSVNDIDPITREFELVDGGKNLVGLNQPTVTGLTYNATERRVEVALTVIADTSARVEYAIAPTQPLAGSGLWTYAGARTTNGTLNIPSIPFGRTVWVRARSEADNRRSSAWTNAQSIAISGNPAVYSVEPTLLDGADPSLLWDVNDHTAGIRLKYAVYGDEDPIPSSLTTFGDFAAADLSVVLSGIRVPQFSNILISAEGYTGWNGTNVTGVASGEVYTTGQRLSETYVAPEVVITKSQTNTVGSAAINILYDPQYRVTGLRYRTRIGTSGSWSGWATDNTVPFEATVALLASQNSAIEYEVLAIDQFGQEQSIATDIIEYQGPTVVALIGEIETLNPTANTVRARIYVANPFPNAQTVTITFTKSANVPSVTAVSGTTIAHGSVTASLSTTGYVEFDITRPVSGDGVGRVSFVASAAGREVYTDAVDIADVSLNFSGNAADLVGTTLAANVIYSSLQTVGPLTSLTVVNDANVGGIVSAFSFAGSGATLTDIDAGAIETGVLLPSRGGTGIGSYTAGNYIRAFDSGTLEQRTPTQVRSDIGAAAIGHTHPFSDITSLPTSLAGYGIVDGVSTGGSYANPSWITSLAFTKITYSGLTTGQVLRATGAAAAAFGALDLANANAVTGTLPNARTTATAVNTASTIVARDGTGSFSAGQINATFAGSGAALTNLDAGAIATGTLAVGRGGTGLGSYTAGNYIRAFSASVLEQRTPAQVLSDIGASAVGHTHPFTDITSLPTSLAGYGIVDGVSTGGSYANPAWITSLAFTKLTFSGLTSGTVLRATGATTVAFGALDLANASAVTGTLANARTTATAVNTASTIVARDGSGNFSAGLITATFSGSGASLTNLDAGAIATGTLPVSRGGTGLGSYTAGNYIRAFNASTLEQRTPAQVLSDIGASALGHTHPFSDITSLPTSLAGYGITDAVPNTRTVTIINGTGITGGGAAQALSANVSWTIGLTGQALALHNLATNGVIVRTGSGTVAGRTLTGTANQVTITNGDGVSGNPTFALPQNIHTAATPTFGGGTFNGTVVVSRAQNTTAAAFTNPFLRLAPSAQTDTTGLTVVTYGVSTVNLYGWSVGARRTGVDANSHAFVWISHVNSAAGVEQMRLSSTGLLTVANGLTVSAAGISVTGNSTFSAQVTAASFSGSGATLTNLDAGAIATGVLLPARGGTGIGSYTAGNYLRAFDASTMEQRTPAQVRSDIGAAATGHTHPFSDITSLPTSLAGYGIVDGVSTGSTYNDPAWLTGVAWSKINSKPTTLAGYGITDALSNSASSTQSGYFGDIFLRDDTNPSHYLQITAGSDLTATRILTLLTGDAARTLTLNGNATLVAGTMVPTSLTLTIANGTGITGGSAAVNLSANRSWTIALTGQALALHNLATNGLIARTGAGTVAGRTITGTANQVTVTNGDGVSGNPTLSLPQNIHTAATPTFGGLTVNGSLSVVSNTVTSGTIYANNPSAAIRVRRTASTDNNYDLGVFYSSGLYYLASWSGSNGLRIDTTTGNVFASGTFYTISDGYYAYNSAAGVYKRLIWSYTHYTLIYRQDNNIGIYLGGGADPNSYYDNNNHYFRDASGTLRFTIAGATGNVTATGTVTATNWILSSDLSKKSEIEELSGGLDIVRATPSIKYWHNDHKQYEIGFGAQHLLSNKYGPYMTTKLEDGSYGVFYDRTIPVLWNAVREQDTEVASLKKRVFELEQKVARLEAVH